MAEPSAIGRTAFCALAVLAACTTNGPEPDPSAGNPSEVDSTTVADDSPGTIDLANIPLSVPRPHAPLVVSGSCPGECCGYGVWLTGDVTRVFAQPYDTTRVAFTLAPRQTLTAGTGYVRIDSLGAAVMTADGIMFQRNGGRDTIPQGDTVLLVGYDGEGYYHAWHNGRVGSVDVETQSTVLRELAAEWWVEITSPAGDGWLWMDRTPMMWGVSACGLPGPPPAGVEPCSTAWLEKVEEAMPISDAEGHGPDLGSDEWMGALSRRLGIEDGEASPGSEEWCASVDRILWGPFG